MNIKRPTAAHASAPAGVPIATIAASGKRVLDRDIADRDGACRHLEGLVASSAIDGDPRPVDRVASDDRWKRRRQNNLLPCNGRAVDGVTVDCIQQPVRQGSNH